MTENRNNQSSADKLPRHQFYRPMSRQKLVQAGVESLLGLILWLLLCWFLIIHSPQAAGIFYAIVIPLGVVGSLGWFTMNYGIYRLNQRLRDGTRNQLREEEGIDSE